MRILFFTSDIDVTTLAEEISGHNITVLSDFSNLDECVAAKPDLIFLDTDIGQAEVLDIVDRLKLEQGAFLVIMTSTMSVGEIRSHQRSESGADAYLVKPLSEQTLVDTIDDFIQSNHELTAVASSSDMDDDEDMDMDLDLDMDLEMDSMEATSADIDIPLDDPTRLTTHVAAQDNGDDLATRIATDSALKFQNMQGMRPSDSEQIDIDEDEDLDIDLDMGSSIDLDISQEFQQPAMDQASQQDDDGITIEEDDEIELNLNDNYDVEEGDNIEIDVNDRETDEVRLSSSDDLEIEMDDSEDGDIDLNLDGMSLDDDDDDDDLDISLQNSIGSDEGEQSLNATVLHMDLAEEEEEVGESTQKTMISRQDVTHLGLNKDDESADISFANLNSTSHSVEEEFMEGQSTRMVDEDSIGQAETRFEKDAPLNKSDSDELSNADNPHELKFNKPLEEFRYSKSQEVEIPVYDDQTKLVSEIDSKITEDVAPASNSKTAVTATTAQEALTIHEANAIKTVEGLSQEMAQHLDQSEMARLQGTIREIREERQRLLERVNDLESENSLVEQDNLTLRSELDEIKIELNILKKRQNADQDDIKRQLIQSEEKKALYEEKLKRVEKEFEKLNQKVRFDINKVRQRERELEGQLELVKMDADAQIKSREAKIIELKRKIDALEFNIENASIKEQKSLSDRHKMEDKLSKIMQTLKRSMKVIEEDIDINEEAESSSEIIDKV